MFFGATFNRTITVKCDYGDGFSTRNSYAYDYGILAILMFITMVNI